MVPLQPGFGLRARAAKFDGGKGSSEWRPISLDTWRMSFESSSSLCCTIGSRGCRRWLLTFVLRSHTLRFRCVPVGG